jgi:methyl-accepting chemotaxis protein
MYKVLMEDGMSPAIKKIGAATAKTAGELEKFNDVVEDAGDGVEELGDKAEETKEKMDGLGKTLKQAKILAATDTSV